MMNFNSIDKKVSSEGANLIANSLNDYFKGIQRIYNRSVQIQNDFFKSINLTETEFLKLSEIEQNRIRIDAKAYYKTATKN